jgi:hypothetical protein
MTRSLWGVFTQMFLTQRRRGRKEFIFNMLRTSKINLTHLLEYFQPLLET